VLGDHAGIDPGEAALFHVEECAAIGGLGGVGDFAEHGGGGDEGADLDAPYAARELVLAQGRGVVGGPGFVGMRVAHFVEGEQAFDELGGDPGFAEPGEISGAAENFFEGGIEAQLEFF